MIRNNSQQKSRNFGVVSVNVLWQCMLNVVFCIYIYIWCACCLCLLAAGMNFGTAAVPAINNAPPGTNRLSFCHLACVVIPAWLFGLLFSNSFFNFISWYFAFCFYSQMILRLKYPVFFLLCFHIPQLCHSSVFCSFQRNLVVSHLCENYPHNFFFSFFFTWLPCIYPFFNFILLLCFVHTALNPSSPPVCYSSLCVQGLGYSISDTVHPWVASILLKCYRTPDL